MVANTIGAGIYTTSGYSLQGIGTREGVLLVWLASALLALAGAVSFGALAKALPKSGGEYLYLSRLLHPAAGFIAGWVSLVAAFAGAEAYAAITFTEYIGLSPGPAKAIAIGILIALTLLQGTLIRIGTVLQNLTVVAKALFLFLFSALGMFLMPNLPAEASNVSPDPWVWPVNLMWVSLSFTGFNSAIYVAQECVAPKRDIPKALVAGTIITAVLYLMVNAVLLYSAPVETLAGHPDIALRSAYALGGETLREAVRWLVLLSLFTLISGMAVAGPRVAVKMGEDGFLPPMSLTTAALGQGGLAVLMTLNASLVGQLGYLSLTLSLTSALAVYCVFKLKPADRPNAFFPLFYIAGTSISAIASLKVQPLSGAATLVTVLSGFALYFLVARAAKTAAPGDPTATPPGTLENDKNQNTE